MSRGLAVNMGHFLKLVWGKQKAGPHSGNRPQWRIWMARNLEKMLSPERNSRHHLRPFAMRVYGSSCLVCGWNLASLDLHHIRPGHAILNVVMLCPNCHRLVHEGKLDTPALQLAQDKALANLRASFASLSPQLVDR